MIKPGKAHDSILYKSIARVEKRFMPPKGEEHCTPEEAWTMAEEAGAELFLPVHHQTFALSREPYLEPIERTYAAAGNHPERIVIDGIGQEFRVA